MKMDIEEKFISFDFAKITCGREITADTGYSKYCQGRELSDILDIPFIQTIVDLRLKEEESQYVLYLEWDALRSAIAQYLGLENTTIDKDRCQITAIEHSGQAIEVAMVILPPKELPKILPCSLADKAVPSEN